MYLHTAEHEPHAQKLSSTMGLWAAQKLSPCTVPADHPFIFEKIRSARILCKKPMGTRGVVLFADNLQSVSGTWIELSGNSFTF